MSRRLAGDNRRTVHIFKGCCEVSIPKKYVLALELRHGSDIQWSYDGLGRLCLVKHDDRGGTGERPTTSAV